MSSLKLRDTFAASHGPADTSDTSLDTPSPSHRNRPATVYDACAGRVTTDRFLPSVPRQSKYRDTLSSSTLPIPPDEVLFRRKNAPERYNETDIYWADQKLEAWQRLPDSDLLKAIHAYASEFYGRATTNAGRSDWRSMDETALLALGVLLEEAAVEELGETGDFAFVEGDEQDERLHSRGNRHESVVENAHRKRKKRKRDVSG